jgi:APA family basic amino acid/polyamine antiporter
MVNGFDLMAENSTPLSGQLKRSLGTFALIIYGIGDILGAGIYVLIGKVAGAVGPACWLSFGVAFFVASITGLTYSELGTRFPHSAGESVYSLQAFRKRLLSYLVGFLVLLSGMVSMATVARGFSGYVQAVLPEMPEFLIIPAFLLVLAVINFWGIRQSSIINIICTTIEVAGLVIVIAAGMQYFGGVDYLSVHPAEGVSVHVALLQGGILAFYAFIGFEDIVNVAEETQQPSKTIPRAITVALITTSVCYMLTAIAAVSAVPPSELSASSAPLMLVVERGFPDIPRELFTLIALFAVTNTALINFIMSSRILYGMSRKRLVSAVLGRIHLKRQTPYFAIMVTFVIVIVLALTEGLEILAQSTSFLLLSVFLLMNLSLIMIKTRSKTIRPPFRVPIWIPILGVTSCLILMFFVQLQALLTVFTLILVGIIIYIMQKPYLDSHLLR